MKKLMIAVAAVAAIGMLSATNSAFAGKYNNNGYGNGYDRTNSGSYDGSGYSQGNSGEGESRYGQQSDLKDGYSCYCR